MYLLSVAANRVKGVLHYGIIEMDHNYHVTQIKLAMRRPFCGQSGKNLFVSNCESVPKYKSCPGGAAKQSWCKRADGDENTLQPNGSLSNNLFIFINIEMI